MLLLHLRSCKTRGTLDKVTSSTESPKSKERAGGGAGSPGLSRKLQKDSRESFLPIHLSSQLPLCLRFRARGAVLGAEPLEVSEAKFTSGNLS